MICHIEIFLDSIWQPAASFESMGDEALGATGKARLCYDPAYVVNNQGRREAVLSSLFPVTFEWNTESQRWPAFMLDILPTGAARRTWLNRLEQDLPSDERADWRYLSRRLLQIGGGNPIGNLRIAEAVEQHNKRDDCNHPGFDYEEITMGRALYGVMFDTGSAGSKTDASRRT